MCNYTIYTIVKKEKGVVVGITTEPVYIPKGKKDKEKKEAVKQ